MKAEQGALMPAVRPLRFGCNPKAGPLSRSLYILYFEGVNLSSSTPPSLAVRLLRNLLMLGGMTQKKEWIVMHCLDAYRDANGQPGAHKIPLEGYDTPMTKAEALAALKQVVQGRPNQDFSIRKIAAVVEFTP